MLLTSGTMYEFFTNTKEVNKKMLCHNLISVSCSYLLVPKDVEISIIIAMLTIDYCTNENTHEVTNLFFKRISSILS